MMKRTRKNFINIGNSQENHQGRSQENTGGAKEVITEEEMNVAKLLPPIEKKMFYLRVGDTYFDASYKMEQSKTNPDVWHLKNVGHYFPKKNGGVKNNTGPDFFVFDGYVFKKNKIQST